MKAKTLLKNLQRYLQEYPEVAEVHVRVFRPNFGGNKIQTLRVASTGLLFLNPEAKDPVFFMATQNFGTNH